MVPLASRPGRVAERGRWKIRKTLSDYRWLMHYIEEQVQKKGLMAEVITVRTVYRMFEQSVTKDLETGKGRDGQKKWNTVAKDLRKRLKLQREAG